MKLLVVTGVVNSGWLPTYTALNSSMEKLADSVPDFTARLKPLLKQNAAISSQELIKALGVQNSDAPYMLCDEKRHFSLSQWNNLPELKSVVFYSSPVNAIASALSQNNMSVEECNTHINEWGRQIESVFRFYQKNKESCLLLDIDDVNKHLQPASKLISSFIGQDLTLAAFAKNILPDAIVAANLLLSERDYLFELYDEIRSTAPIFDDFQLSGSAEYDVLAADIVESMQRNREVSAAKAALAETIKNQKAALEELKQKNEAQVAALQKQSAALTSDATESARRLEALTSNYSRSTVEVATLKDLLKNQENENELLILQVGQLQEELEGNVVKNSAELGMLNQKINDKNNQLIACKKDEEKLEKQVTHLTTELKDTSWKNTQEITQLSNKLESKDKELVSLKATGNELNSQVTQLNEKLEKLRLKSANELKELNQKIINKNEQIVSLKAIKSEITTKLTKQAENNELNLLQIEQMQDELESLYEINKNLSGQFSACESVRNQMLKKESQLQQKMHTIEAENEIATLQINQLQEELESYFELLQIKDSQTLFTKLASQPPCQNVFDEIIIGSVEIKGAYETDFYQDVKLLLNKIKLANGQEFEKLSVKLVEISGQPGIEFRPSEIEGESASLQWREDMQDDYGYFIRFIPEPKVEQQALQQKTSESLCASDRLLVLSIATKIADALQMIDDSNLPEGKLRDWKLIALSLKNQIAKLPIWMSFDELSLVEEMRTDNYEHLWLRFNHLLVNDYLRPEFDIKFAATDLTENDGLFSKQLMLEIRQQDNQLPPLQAWPPVEKDDYGYKLQAFVDLTEDELHIHTAEKLSDSDYQFLRHLLKNLVNFLQLLTAQNVNLDRSMQDWIAIGDRIVQMGKVKPEILEEDLSEELEVSEELKLDVMFKEHIDLGGYQHLLFQQLISDDEVLLIKIRAENINQEAQTAELFLELRTGNEKIPLANTEFFGEDDFGPRVLMPLANLQTDILDKQAASMEIKLLSLFNEEITNLIDKSAELNESQQQLWFAMLTNR